MPRVAANGVEIEYDEVGDPGAPPLLLVSGLGSQMITWDDRFCSSLAAEGFRVVRFDNRDVGRSSWLSGRQVDLSSAMGAAMTGSRVDAPYVLSDMADDAFGLLERLAIGSAHLVGASMGGMIVQTMAIERPTRVRSMTSIMSTTGESGVGSPTGEAMQLLLKAAPTDRDGYVDAMVAAGRVLAGETFPYDENRARDLHGRAYDRGHNPGGVLRQMVAIMASGDRTDDLGGLTVPTLVIHGDADPLVGHSGGVATAKAVPGADLVTVEGMGHSLPEHVWPTVIEAIAGHARRAEAEAEWS